MNALTRADGHSVGCLGLGGTSATKPQLVDRAYRSGVDYFFAYSTTFGGMLQGVSALCRRHRDEIVVATGDEGRDPEGLVRSRDQLLTRFGTSFLDIFYLEYVSPEDDPSSVRNALELLGRWKEEGVIRYVGASAHDRGLAESLLKSGQIDVLMHRYNMAHRKSEISVLPCAEAAGIPVVAFTCTRWGSLMKGHPEWRASVPTAADCYRFALSHPAIRLALTAPASIAELDQNTQHVNPNALPEADRSTWSAYGDLVYGDGMDAFETRWP